MSYYHRHVFFCVNDRGEDAERPSCNLCGAAAMRDYAKKRDSERRAGLKRLFDEVQKAGRYETDYAGDG